MNTQELNIIEFIGLVLVILSLIGFVVASALHLASFVVPMIFGKIIMGGFFGGGMLAAQFSN